MKQSFYLALFYFASFSAAIDLRLENDTQTEVSIPSEDPIQTLLSEEQPHVDEDNSVVLVSETAESFYGTYVPPVDKVLFGDALVDKYQTHIETLSDINVEGGNEATVFSTCIRVPDIEYGSPAAIALYVANI